MASVDSSATQHTLQSALGSRYEFEREIGRGGMATVYLARDVRHGRHVAVKVLHPELSAVLGRERFLREIEVTASLQHPNILPLFDSGEASGLLYYVMPYVHGETLRAWLEREQQLPVADAVRIATEIADALQYAHARGVLHRDVKPENVLLAGQPGEGRVAHALVADFGIALAVRQAAGDRMTNTGVSLGTPHYMAPEQAAGERTIGGRADVYALGVVLYEMLAGEPPFTGPTVQAIVARALTETPKPLVSQRPSVPPHVDAAVRTALAKLPADRFATPALFAAALVSPGLTSGSQESHPADARGAGWRTRHPRAVIALAGGALVLGGVLGWAAGRSSRAATTAQPSGAVRFFVDPDSGYLGSSAWWHSAPAISPDGRTIVFAALTASGTRLYARRVDEVTSRPLAGTDGGDWPFFSPDGEWVGFATGGTIRKVRLQGGSPVLVGEVPRTSGVFLGGSWGADDSIRFTTVASTKGGLYRVSAKGGTPMRIAVADTTRLLLHPYALPGGQALLVTASRDWRVGRLAVLDVETGHVRMFGAGAGARYVGGNILFVGASGALFRQPFDLTELAPVGQPEEIASGLDVTWAMYSPFDVAQSGALVYRVSREGWKLALTDRSGRVQQTLRGLVPWSPRFSPDGRRVAYAASPPGQERGDVWSGEVWTTDIWITELASGTTARLTTDGNDNNEPQWSADGRSMVFDAGLLGEKDIYVQSLDSESARLLVRRRGNQFPRDWALDGSAVLFDHSETDSDPDVWIQPMNGDPARPFLSGPGSQVYARVSPDGRWVAYTSDETGRSEVYLQSYPSLGHKTLVSEGGGERVAWRRDGRELFYWRGDELIAVSLETVQANAPPRFRARTPLFRIARVDAAGFDVSPDGTRFVLVTGGPRANRLVVALNGLHAEARGR